MRFIDPDGRKVVITGPLKQEAVKQLQHKANERITLSMDEKGTVSYTVNKKVKGGAKTIASIIDDPSITINISTVDGNNTSEGMFFIGGAFLGNKVTIDAAGNKTVEANQIINPNVLGKIDEFMETPGKSIMHEITEAYEGAKISQETGKSSKNSNFTESVYNDAHKKATPQNPIFYRYYDKEGNEVQNIRQAVREEIYLRKNRTEETIITRP